MAPATKIDQAIESGAASAWAEIDATLSHMIRDPASSVDPDAVAPSVVSIRMAMRVCSLLQFLAQEAPAAMVPNSGGGIILEWRDGSDSRWIEISESGGMEQVLIRGGQRIFRRTFEI